MTFMLISIFKHTVKYVCKLFNSQNVIKLNELKQNELIINKFVK